MGFIIVQPPFSYLKAFHLKKLLRTDTPFDYIISFIRHNMHENDTKIFSFWRFVHDTGRL